MNEAILPLVFALGMLAGVALGDLLADYCRCGRRAR